MQGMDAAFVVSLRGATRKLWPVSLRDELQTFSQDDGSRCRKLLLFYHCAAVIVLGIGPLFLVFFSIVLSKGCMPFM